MARPIRFLLAVALGAALVLLVAALLGSVYFERAPRDESPRRDHRAAEPVVVPRRSPIVIPPPIAPPYHLLKEDELVEGPTRFVRRLEAGTHLLALADELARGAVSGETIEPGYLALLPYLLAADGAPPAGYRAGLRALTKPRRDREALYLHKGPVGRLRVWTLQPELDVRTVQSSGNLLAQLIAVAGHTMPQGVDVLCTPEMGRDVFPKQAHLAGAAGLYLRRDRYCTVRSTMEQHQVSDTMRHEVVHAYSLGPAELRSAPRFVTEGIAEYLRFLGPRDGGFQIPPHTMRDELAYLVRAFEFMERMGVDLSSVKPAWLVNLKPWQFYRLPFGYPTALAMHAYVGGAPVEEAMRSQSPEPLIRALSQVQWSKFRDWLELEANGGAAEQAWFTNDGVEQPPDGEAGETGWTVLRRIGAVTKSNRKMTSELFDAMGKPDQIAAVMKMLTTERGSRRVVLATTLSKDMDRVLGSVTGPEDLYWHSERESKPRTPREFVADLRYTLEYPGKPIWRITAPPHNSEKLAGWLREIAAPNMGLVLCSSQPVSGRTARSILKQPDAIPANAIVLLIDLCPSGPGELALLGQELARRGHGMRVAYWRP